MILLKTFYPKYIQEEIGSYTALVLPTNLPEVGEKVQSKSYDDTCE